MMLPIDIIIRVDAKKENDSGEYTFQCKALGELVRCKDCKFSSQDWENAVWCRNEGVGRYNDWFCADGKRKDGEHDV